MKASDNTSHTPSGCLICGAPLVYTRQMEPVECVLCHGHFLSNARCENGHYICDSCHEKDALQVIYSFCLHTKQKYPVSIMQELIRFPQIHMHGPEHHVLVGSALLAACKNCGAGFELEPALLAMRERGSQVPGGICGQWGSCGAGISAGITVSILTEATPLSGREWGLANQMTARCLSAIGAIGGPRCCKRDSYTALITAAEFIREHFHIDLETPESIICHMSGRNEQCLGASCPYNSQRTGEN